MDIRSEYKLELPKSDVPVRLPAPRQPVFDATIMDAPKQPKHDELPHEYNPGVLHALLADTQEAFTGIAEDFTSGESLRDTFSKHNRLRGVGVLFVLIGLVIMAVYLIKIS